MKKGVTFGNLRLSPMMNGKEPWKICVGQDGEIFGDWLFRFEGDGTCTVYSVSTREKVSGFALDRREVLCPHSNAVCFGPDFYCEGDEFPLLYTNLYNSCEKQPDRKEGYLCVYRLMRDGLQFTTRLVQVISIGFTEDRSLWKSCEGSGDVRPYGNFAVDPENRMLYAFVMRDLPEKTRFFTFRLPSVTAGEESAEFGVPFFRLEREAILDQFDVDYFQYIQGVICDRGRIVSTEGFHIGHQEPMIRVIDPKEKRITAQILLEDCGFDEEPEFIARLDGALCYIDSPGNVYRIEYAD